jgi:putative CocE/NonD family hydrolase
LPNSSAPCAEPGPFEFTHLQEGKPMSYRGVSEVRDSMQIDWDMPIELDDGLVVRADIFRPIEDGHYPVTLSYGPYAKWLHFVDGYETAWKRMEEKHPDVMAGTSNRYASWEVRDPEKWVPHGYVCVRVESRGAGRSLGYVELWSPRETQDFANCIEWTGPQPWSNGKVGLSGISYYAVNQWQVAALQPKHLAAICVWGALPTSIASSATTAASIRPSPRTGTTCRSVRCSTDSA